MVQGYRQEQLTQTLIVCFLPSSSFLKVPRIFVAISLVVAEKTVKHEKFAGTWIEEVTFLSYSRPPGGHLAIRYRYYLSRTDLSCVIHLFKNQKRSWFAWGKSPLSKRTRKRHQIWPPKILGLCLWWQVWLQVLDEKLLAQNINNYKNEGGKKNPTPMTGWKIED